MLLLHLFENGIGVVTNQIRYHVHGIHNCVHGGSQNGEILSGHNRSRSMIIMPHFQSKGVLALRRRKLRIVRTSRSVQLNSVQLCLGHVVS